MDNSTPATVHALTTAHPLVSARLPVATRGRRGALVLAVGTVFLLNGCGGSGTSPNASSDSPTAVAQAATLADTCPLVSDVLPELPSRADGDQPEWAAAATDLRGLSDAGDDDVKQALSAAIASADELATVDNDPIVKDGEVVLPYLDAEENIDQAMAKLRDACDAEGAPLT